MRVRRFVSLPAQLANRFAIRPSALAIALGGAGFALLATVVGACASNDSTTHGFVATDSGQMDEEGSDAAIGHVVTSGGDDDASMLPGDDDGSLPDAGTGGDDDSSTGAGDDASTGGGNDGGSNDGGSTGGDSGSDAGNVHVCDGVVGASEYGDETAGKHSYVTSGQTWYVDWDAVNLYVAIIVAPVAEPMVLFVGDSSKASSGISNGYSTYDGTDPSSLAFPATFVVYAKYDSTNTTTHFYAEARTPSGTAWSAPSTTGLNVCFTSATSQVREVVIPWAVAGTGAGLPAALSFEGYVENGNSSSPDIYGQIPMSNPTGGGANVTAAAPHRFLVANTATLPPFGDPL